MLPLLVDGTPEFSAAITRLSSRGADDLDAVAPVVREILADVRRAGDAAVRRYIEAYEHRSPAELTFDLGNRGKLALGRLNPAERKALELAADRIARYHARQVPKGYDYEEEGVALGMRVRPLRRVGVYAPGGKARYPSSVLMAAVPARVAGVRDIVLATPAPDDRLLAAAHLAGVTRVLDAGGAHAIGAMAYGTASLPRVDKIVGPGNVYVACAKRLVFGEVAIDGIAGPSEIVVVADDTADPALVAADLAAQAEHDESAYPILVSTCREVCERALAALEADIATETRRAIIEASVQGRGAVLLVATRARAAEIANTLAAEHLALHVRDPEELFASVDAVGAALVGGITPVAAGDYFAGPSHVLPTGGAVRYGSPLGAYNFVARSSMIRYSRSAIAAHAPHIAILARAEGLEAHARSVELRCRGVSGAESGA